MRNRRQATGPKFMRAKYAGTCAQTNESFAVGANILYDPSTRKAYCENSQAYRDFESAEFDRVVMGREY